MQKTTTNHDEIRKWVEQHGGKPALIDHPQAQGDKVGIRIDFPGKEDEALLSDTTVDEDTTWEEFFRIFDEQQLVFVYDIKTRGNDPTGWYHFAYRSSVLQREGLNF